ncbi:uncharacterized protein LOC110102735 isoform X1 [Dendrobium catenatum]|uniref:uncharacterized protein LOC110102735 isoform X1 n=1 Tax=Dendrobium catenatum TaxID=906689 RepID=UPI00109FC171|nr:uncharacterized protein LOC110102735 isoform X1 [Dendrobium catenatum]
MLIPYPLTPTHDLVLLIDPCYFSKFLLPCISFKAVKVCIQTQQGFARGLSDGLSKIVKSKENLRFISRNAIQNTFKAVTVRVPIGLEALNFQISKHRSFFFNVLVTVRVIL